MTSNAIEPEDSDLALEPGEAMKVSPEEQALCLLLGFSATTFTYKGVSRITIFSNPTWMFFLSQGRTWVSTPRHEHVPGKHYPTLLAALQAYPEDQAEYFPPDSRD